MQIPAPQVGWSRVVVQAVIVAALREVFNKLISVFYPDH